MERDLPRSGEETIQIAPTAGRPWAAGAPLKPDLGSRGRQRWGDFADPYTAGPLPFPALNSLWRVSGATACVPSLAEGDDHLQLALPVHLHHGRPQLPLVSGWQEALRIRGDSKNVPES